MARKYYAAFETKEQFDKCIHDVYQEGYDSGFKDGVTNGLAHVIVGIEDQFDDKQIAEAESMTRRIHISQWKKKQKYEEGIKKLAVSEYLKSQQQG